ncbi:hypothetical protein RRG08_004069 [Elysia crispata]|uniref:Uncharacterized protein n=1 Tax=Elysia crispata TaxID=231223 RepID=A0AAE1E4M1_9GAST|nr:hypothetical protein RRG08_004069 [Elysia crispata]
MSSSGRDLNAPLAAHHPTTLKHSNYRRQKRGEAHREMDIKSAISAKGRVELFGRVKQPLGILTKKIIEGYEKPVKWRGPRYCYLIRRFISW